MNYATANDTASRRPTTTAGERSVSSRPARPRRPSRSRSTATRSTSPTRRSWSTSAAPVNATLADGQGVGTITDDEGVPSLRDRTTSRSPRATVGHGQRQLHRLACPTRAGRGSPSTYATADGTATAGADYTAGSGNLEFAPGVRPQPLTVQVKSDTIDEFDETFTVNLSGATNASIGDGFGLGTITDDDALVNLSDRPT